MSIKINASYRWLLEGLFWGVFMFLSMGVIYPWITDEVITQAGLIKSFIFWMGAGLIYGYFFVRWMRRRKDGKNR